MRFLDVIKTRRSVRHFQSKPLSEEMLMSILEAGCAAPSAHNSQPWRFVVLRGEKKDALAEFLFSVSREKRYISFTGFYVNRLLRHSARMIKEAPAVIAVFNAATFMSKVERYFPYSRREILHTMEIQSVAAAVENMLLATHAQGLGAVWLGVPLLVPQELIEDFFKTRDELMVIMPIGYPATMRTVEKKVDLSEHVEFWG